LSSSHEGRKVSRRDLPEPPPFFEKQKRKERVSGRITVYVDDRAVSLYRGMQVRHALTSEQVSLVESGAAEVRNSYGHAVGLHGALGDGQKLSFHRKNR